MTLNVKIDSLKLQKCTNRNIPVTTSECANRTQFLSVAEIVLNNRLFFPTKHTLILFSYMLNLCPSTSVISKETRAILGKAMSPI